MRQKIRILQVVTRMGRGGAETMIMNYYRCLDREKYQFDFLVHRQEKADYDDEIEQLGGRIFRAMPIRPGNYLKYFSFLDSFFRKHAHEFVAVHCHIQENSGFVCKYAYKYGIENRLCTSHIADLGIDYKFPFRLFAKIFGYKYINKRLACGEEAGKFLYGKDSFLVFPNAIDAKKFSYRKDEYDKIRKRKGWSDYIIIGNVSRFNHQKNHEFIISIFSDLVRINPNCRLALVGGGDLEDKIKNQVKKLGLEKYVFFEGIQTDIATYMKGFDVLLFPSLYEGLPVSIIEAQAAGLLCFLSDTIDKSVDITGNVIFKSLKETSVSWSEKILSSFPYERKNTFDKIVSANYDVNSNIMCLLQLYTSK